MMLSERFFHITTIQWRMDLLTKPIIIAHRGASGHAPENTLLSYRRALDFGAQMIELDVHETLDGQLVCIHDSTVDRTTDGSGEVHDFTYNELRDLDAGEGERIPLLEDVLKFASGKLQVNIELKVIGVEKNLLDILDRLEMLSNVLISSFIHGILATVRNLNEHVLTAILISKPMDELVGYALDFNANAINPHYQLVSPKLLEQSHDLGLKVYPWTINDSTIMHELVSVGVDGIITDYPDQAFDVLRTLD
jgi:glycerophosphoryl diester phosphodiesterase